MILVIDNYDSFTYNIVQYLGILKKAVTVWRNDSFLVEDIKALNPEAIIISPGPGYPSEAGLSLKVIETYKRDYPILGVCLGHQAIGQVEGGLVKQASQQLHGKTSLIDLEADPIFKGLSSPLEVVRYHSLVVDAGVLPDQLKVLARDDKGEIMALKHRTYPLYGLQFHPESYGTKEGMKVFENFLEIAVKHADKQNKNEAEALIGQLVGQRSLTFDEARKVFGYILSGQASDPQIACVLTALKIKGESPEEIAGAASVLRDKTMRSRIEGTVVDTCGTGGDGSGSFNISTATALVVAGAGVKVAKHGNRSITSRSGSADVLEALGVPILNDEKASLENLKRHGIGFFYAPAIHKSMKAVMPVRKSLGFRTIFNLLGPLCNPVELSGQIIGVGDKTALEKMAEAGRILGLNNTLFLSSERGLDELTLTGTNKALHVNRGQVKPLKISARDLGFVEQGDKSLKGGSAYDNANIMLSLLEGSPSAYLDAVLLNAGTALYVSEKAGSIEDGIRLARQAVESGRALNMLKRLQKVTPENGLLAETRAETIKTGTVTEAKRGA